ncbi:MAG: tetratricopeptide repeat protein [Desulfomonile tiedjei]|uniref:Tetratricopeptide repeat protein n=1 Tax=Desulfomonile tiedjei TaxID=2358 RepID=A0A9D6V3G4_9BACT|nr:tetratricopeptide repeat protein [Desulfomonile tiedjei]
MVRLTGLHSFNRVVIPALFVCLFPVLGAVSHSLAAEGIASSAKNAFDEGRFRDAVELYSQVIKQDANVSSLYFERGAAYEMINQTQKAVEDFKKSIELDPANHKAMESLAEIYERRFRRFDDALQLYRKAHELTSVHDSKERLLWNIAILENRLQPDDASPVRCWRLGNIKMAAGEFSRAEVFYSKAIRMDPMMFQAYFSRGLLRLKAGYIHEALKDFEATVRISPSLRGAYIQKGLANQQLGNAEQAHKDLENAARMDPGDPYASFYHGVVLEAKNQPQDALQSYHEAITRNPKLDLRKLIQERIAVLGSAQKRESSKNLKREIKDLW